MRVDRLRRVAFIAGGVLAALLIAAILLLSFGWTWLRGPLEGMLSRRLALPVTIGSLRRVDHGFATATIELRDLRVGQPAWVKGGDLARVGQARVTLPLWPLLWGSARPQAIAVDGLDVTLVRRDATLANWKAIPGGGGGGGGPARITIANGRLHLRDAKRDHRIDARFAADDRGLRLAGAGSLIGRPSRIALTGAPLGGDARWPFRLSYRSAIANLTMAGIADTPLDLGRFDARAVTWGDDLQHLDLLVEAGLPGTAPVRRIEAAVRHERPLWIVKSMRGTIGRSRFSGHVTVRAKAGERTRVDGAVVAQALDFDDLANARGKAIAAAKRAAAPGRRLPDSAIDLTRLMRTDGALDVEVRRIVADRPSAFQGLKGRLVLEQGVLTARPFAVLLTHGVLGGAVTVTQRDTATRLAIDLRLQGSRLETFGDGTLIGPLAGRIVLAGQGGTIRAAIGQANGRVALVARDGLIDRRIALLLGRDLGRGLFADKAENAQLRCGIGSFAVQGGQARTRAIVIDTDVARADGAGAIDLTNERIDLSLTGNPKQKSALRFDGPIRVTGPLFAPEVAAPQATKAGGILKAIGRAIGGKEQPLAGDADCAGLAAAALR